MMIIINTIHVVLNQSHLPRRGNKNTGSRRSDREPS